MQAMFLVGIGEAPGPAQKNKWLVQCVVVWSFVFLFFFRSLDCTKFVEDMLTISQTDRPTAKQLLEHPFMKKAATNQQVTKIVCQLWVCFHFFVSQMQKMLQQIFLTQAFSNDGKKGHVSIF